MAAPGQRLHHRHQRWHSGSIARVLALCALCIAFYYFEVCLALSRAPSLEPIELRNLRAVDPGWRRGRESEHPVGKLPDADDGNLGAWSRDHLAGTEVPHHGDLCCVLPVLRVHQSADDGKSVASGGCAPHRAGISTLYLLYDHRPEDYC